MFLLQISQKFINGDELGNKLLLIKEMECCYQTTNDDQDTNIYRKISNMRHTKSQNLNVSHLALGVFFTQFIEASC